MFRHFTLAMDTYVRFLSYLPQFFLERDMFLTKVVEKNQKL